MKLERIVVESTYKNWKGLTETRETEYLTITKKEVEDLKTWLTSSQVSFKGFNGKVYFHKDTEFPRYKFTEYSRNNNKIVRRVKDIKNTDVVVLDTTYFLKELDNILKNAKYYEKDLVSKSRMNKDSLPVYENLSTSMSVKKLMYGTYNNEKKILETLVELYNTKNTLKTVSVYELTDVLTKTNNPIDSEMSGNLKNLLNSNDEASIKLAMEIMTNSDFESSLFHNILLCSLYGAKMRQNSYWNSTAFKSFRNNMDRMGLTIEYLHNDTMDAVQKFLSIDNKFIFEQDIDFIKKCVKSEIDAQYSMSNTGFELINYEVKLNLDPNKIIKNTPTTEPKEELEANLTN